MKFEGVRDYPYNDHIWMSAVQNIVRTEQEESVIISDGEEPYHSVKLGKVPVCLVGHEKDGTSYYLKFFPQWTYEPFYRSPSEYKPMDSTTIRENYFEEYTTVSSTKSDNWTSCVPESVQHLMEDFTTTADFQRLKEEYDYNKEYQQNSKFIGLSFDPVFVTTDAVVTCKGHILVVRRGANPGKGLLALPGGFLARNISLRDNAIKELKEETKINIAKPILKNLIKDSAVFDYPFRSLRGRTITHAFYLDINLKVEEGLPLVKGGDDASKALWMPISEFLTKEEELFEDHWSIATSFIFKKDE